jgi:hypothetical protein
MIFFTANLRQFGKNSKIDSAVQIQFQFVILLTLNKEIVFTTFIKERQPMMMIYL